MKSIKFILFILLIAFNGRAQLPTMPFPTHYMVTAGCIKPSNYTQTQMDLQVTNFYTAWKNMYLKPGCISGQYYIQYINGANICVSEGQGYGMVILAYMAGFDTQAKAYFDGLFQWYKTHPSTVNSSLMNWRQGTGCVSNGTDAATDGDLDAAYGLLLAHRQWGSGGAINYLNEAKTIINAIKASEIFTTSTTVQLGDWAHNDVTNKDDTRPSDFMYDHFTSFNAFTGDATWNSVKTNCFNLIQTMQATFSPTTGLIPDFIEDVDGTPHPAAANFLESAEDGAYYYNSCRVPWHLGTSYLINGDAPAKTAADKMNAWIRTKTSNNINNLQAGYKLNGSLISGSNYTDMAFIAPLGVSACVNSINQTWLNNIWTYIITDPIANSDYFGNTIKMLCMLNITQNYFPPQTAVATVANDLVFNQETINIYPNPAKETITLHSKINLELGTTISIVDLFGKTIYSETITKNQNAVTIDLTHILEGIYFYEIHNNNNIISKGKFIKQH